MKKLQTIHVNKRNSVLVVVDVENEFCKPGGKIYTETSARVAPGVISSIQKLLSLARGAEIPILYVQSVRNLNESEFKLWGVRPALQKDTWASEIVDEIKPQKGEIVVQKYTHDPFYKTDMDSILNKLVPDPSLCYAIVTGGAVNVCLYHAVLGFHLRDFWTVVPVDCVYYGSDEAYQHAIGQFSEGAAYPNVFLSRSELINSSKSLDLLNKRPAPGT